MSNNVPIVELSDKEAKEIGSQLVFSLQGGVSVENLLAVYEIIYLSLQEEGGCDHGVGHCVCATKNALELLAEKLGFSGPDPAPEDFTFPEPAELRKNAGALAEPGR